MPKKLNLINKNFDRLTVLSEFGKNKYGCISWLCKCSCGNEKIVLGTNLARGRIKSCGCIRSETTALKNRRHGLRNTKLYAVWLSMKQRCMNSNNKRYNDYGGRGIDVCDQWRNNFVSFYNWSMKNGYSEGLTIDRINNDKGYFPKNCRWTTYSINNQNKRNPAYVKSEVLICEVNI